MFRIFALRKPKTNIQILQQNVLLKQKHLVGFLQQHGQEVFGEVRAAYVDTLSRVLSSHFRAYLSALERLQVSSYCPPGPLILQFVNVEVTTTLPVWVSTGLSLGVAWRAACS